MKSRIKIIMIILLVCECIWIKREFKFWFFFSQFQNSRSKMCVACIKLNWNSIFEKKWKVFRQFCFVSLDLIQFQLAVLLSLYFVTFHVTMAGFFFHFFFDSFSFKHHLMCKINIFFILTFQKNTQFPRNNRRNNNKKVSFHFNHIASRQYFFFFVFLLDEYVFHMQTHSFWPFFNQEINSLLLFFFVEWSEMLVL